MALSIFIVFVYPTLSLSKEKKAEQGWGAYSAHHHRRGWLVRSTQYTLAETNGAGNKNKNKINRSLISWPISTPQLDAGCFPNRDQTVCVWNGMVVPVPHDETP